MEPGIFPIFKFLKSRLCPVIGLILTQLLFAVVCAHGLTNHSSFAVPDAKSSAALSLAEWIASSDFVSAERMVRQVSVDIDNDGDPDLVAVTSLPRLLVWLNDGHGNFTSWHSSSSLRCSRILEDPDSNDEDSPLLFLWLEARVLNLRLIPLASARPDAQSVLASSDCLDQSSPRAPPLQIS
jgi:hypothetical protein